MKVAHVRKLRQGEELLPVQRDWILNLAVDFQLHLETETVEHCYPSKPLCAAPDDPVRSVLRRLQEERTGAAMVCLDGRLLGIFTERDALRLLADGASLDAPVSQQGV